MRKEKLYGFAIKLMAAVVGITLVACDKYDTDQYETKSMEIIADPVPAEPDPEPVPDLKFVFDRDSINRGYEYEAWWLSKELVTDTKAQGRLLVTASHEKDQNAVFEKDKQNVIDVEYARANTTYGDVKSEEVFHSSTEKQWKHTQRVTAQLRDGGTLCHLDWSTVVSQISVRDTMRWFPADSVGMEKPMVKSLRFVDVAKTRAAEEYYVDKEHPFFVEVTWSVPVTTVHLAQNYAYVEEVRDTIMDYPMVKNDIKSAETVDSTRNVIDDESEICEFDIIYHHQNGDTTRTHRSIILHREITTIPEYTKTVTSFAYNWLRDEKLQIGTASKAANHNEDNWSVLGRTDRHVALITNTAEPVNTDYGYYHESAHYKDEFVEIDFPFITPVMREKKSWVESVEGDGYWDKARLFNTIDTEYLRWQQTAQETVLLQKEAKRVTSESWDKANCWQRILDNKVQWHFEFITVYSDGETVKTVFDFEADRYLDVLTAWSSIEKSESQSTNKVSAGDITSKVMSLTQKGATLNYTRETREYNSTATLVGSKQANKWKAVEPMNPEIEYKGQRFAFDRDNISFNNGATVTGGNKVGDYKVYQYGDVLTYTRGNNVKTAIAPGEIKVKAEEPENLISEKWDEGSAKQTVYDDKIDRSLDRVWKYSTGREVRATFALSISRTLQPISNWTSIEANANQKTDMAVASVTNSSQSKDVNGAKFSWVNVKRDISDRVKLNASTQVNEWIAEDPLDCTVTYNGDTFTFPKLTVSMSNSASVGNATKNGNYEEYKYADKLSYSLGGNTKYSSAPGLIKIQSESIVSEDWDSSSAKQVVSDGNVSWSLDWVEKYSTGREVRTNFSLSDSRSLTPITDWTSEETSSKQSTGSATASTSSSAQSKDVNGAKFAWTRVTRDITSKAKLNASTQVNEWTAVDPLDCSVTYKGKTFTFPKLTVSMSNSASTNYTGKNEDYEIYKYADKLSYSLGSNTKYSSAPGLINVVIPKGGGGEPEDPTFFPEKWGNMEWARQTVANNERHNSWVYTWSLGFKNKETGVRHVLPVVVRIDAAQPEWNFAYVEITDVTTYNGGTYQSSTDKWINTTASDQPNQMVWTRDGEIRANKNYTEAANLHWDKDNVNAVTGNPSVSTKRFEFSFSKGVFSVKDTYTGVVMGNWTYKYQ